MQKSKADAILHGKCPRCREGRMFKYSTYNLTKFTRMHRECPVCHLQFEQEPGFFFGAMYISYAFSVAIFITVGVALSVLGDFSIGIYLLFTTLTVIILLPLLFRYSRILFLHLFGGIDFDARYGN